MDRSAAIRSRRWPISTAGVAPTLSTEALALLRAVPGWRVVDDRAPGSARERLERDHLLLEAVRSGSAPPTARIWENQRCVVAARSERSLPGLAAAEQALGARGWPVLLRDSGGSAVPHAPGILHLSLAFRPPDGPRCTLESAYEALALPLIRTLNRLGVEARFGDAPGSFCDGRFNLVVGTRKIAGTAQRWRARPGASAPGRGAVLAHALLLVEGDVAEWTGIVNAFYAAAGAPREHRPDTSTTVAECAGGAAVRTGWVERVRTVLASELTELLTNPASRA